MKETKALLEEFAANRHQARLQEIYVDKGVLDYQNGRYQEAIRKYEELPENCRNYIEFIEGQIGYPITMVSNGPGREDIIYRKSAL